jgi:hypothetical protein
MLIDKAKDIITEQMKNLIIEILHNCKSKLVADSDTYVVVDMTKFFSESDEKMAKMLADYVFNNGLSTIGTRADFQASLLATLQKVSVQQRVDALGVILLDPSKGYVCWSTEKETGTWCRYEKTKNTHEDCTLRWVFNMKCDQEKDRCSNYDVWKPPPSPCEPKLSYHPNGYVYFLQAMDKSPYEVLADCITTISPYGQLPPNFPIPDIRRDAADMLAGPQPYWIERGPGEYSGHFFDPQAPKTAAPVLPAGVVAQPAALPANNPIVNKAIESGTLPPIVPERYVPSTPRAAFTVPFMQLTLGEILGSPQFRVVSVILTVLVFVGVIAFVAVSIFPFSKK